MSNTFRASRRQPLISAVESSSTRGAVRRTASRLTAWTVVLLIVGTAWFGVVSAQDVLPSATSKQPVPSPAVQAEITKKLGEIFDFEAAKKPEEQIALAKELYNLSKEARSKPNEEFVLLRKAMELACDGGDAGLMLRAIDAIERRFDIKPMDVKVTMLQRFARNAKTPEKIASLMEGAGTVLRQIMDVHRYDLALQMVDALYAAAQRPGGSKYRKQLLQGRTELRKLGENYQEYKKARTAIEANPADKDASLAVGRWLCMVENNWKDGLFFLVEGTDAEFKEAAKRELETPSPSAVDFARIGDAWWDLAEKKKGEEKSPLMRHAADCYEKAQAKGITGLSKVKIEKRLKDLEETIAATANGQSWLALATADAQPPPRRSPRPSRKTPRQGNVVTGILVAKGEGWIKVKAEGEGEARRYLPFSRGGVPDPMALAAMKQLVVTNLVQVAWKQQEEERRIMGVKVVLPSTKGGVIQGTIMAKDKDSIDLKPEKGPTERYIPNWVGGMPSAGGGPDKRALHAIAQVNVGDEVRVKWLWEARRRVVDIERIRSAEKPEHGEGPKHGEMPRHGERREGIRAEMRGFQGMMTGRLLEKRDASLVFEVSKIMKVWKGNKAENPQKAVGQVITLNLNGLRPHHRERIMKNYGRLREGDEIELEAFDRGAGTLSLDGWLKPVGAEGKW